MINRLSFLYYKIHYKSQVINRNVYHALIQVRLTPYGDTVSNVKLISSLKYKIHLLPASSLSEVYFDCIISSVCYEDPFSKGCKKATQSVYLIGTERCSEGFSRNHFRYIETQINSQSWHFMMFHFSFADGWHKNIS